MAWGDWALFYFSFLSVFICVLLGREFSSFVVRYDFLGFLILINVQVSVLSSMEDGWVGRVGVYGHFNSAHFQGAFKSPLNP